jgi:hypothetical protein
VHPSYTHPWAGTLQMWPYDRSPPPPPPHSTVHHMVPHPAALALSTARASRTATGAAAPQRLLCSPGRRISRHPGTLPMVAHGTRTRWRKTSTR